MRPGGTVSSLVRTMACRLGDANKFLNPFRLNVIWTLVNKSMISNQDRKLVFISYLGMKSWDLHVCDRASTITHVDRVKKSNP